mgnify:CR=1 FL=1
MLLLANKLMHTQEINTEILIGMDDSRIVSDTILLEKETYSAFIQMKDAAEKDGIIIKLVSGFRDFYRQQMIWNNKYRKFTNEFSLDGPTAIKEIIRFSTIPGTSRHHWGTEIDIIDKNFENEKDLDGWTVKIKGFPSGDNFGNTFRVVDEAIQVSYENYDNFDFKFGHIYYTDKKYIDENIMGISSHLK